MRNEDERSAPATSSGDGLTFRSGCRYRLRVGAAACILECEVGAAGPIARTDAVTLVTPDGSWKQTRTLATDGEPIDGLLWRLRFDSPPAGQPLRAVIHPASRSHDEWCRKEQG